MTRSETPSPPPGSISILRRTLVRFAPIIRRERGLVIGAFACMLLEIGFRLLEPWPLKFVFDRVIPSTPTGGSSGIAFIDALTPLRLLTLSAGAFVVIVAARAGAMYLRRVGFALAGSRVLTTHSSSR